MRFNPKARLDTSRVRDSGRGGGGGGMGGGGMRLPIPTGGKAGGGVAGLLVLILFVVLAQCAGIDITGGGGGGGLPGLPSQYAGTNGKLSAKRIANDTGRYANCHTGEDANNSEDCARVAVENSLFGFWKQALPDQADVAFKPESLETFRGQTQTGCGAATAAVGPFYCPVDMTIYLDTGFFQQVLQDQLGGPSGGFVEAYVIAHEYGHHIQNLRGTMGQVRTQQGPHSDSVKLELQADCFAGMWAHFATQVPDADGNVLVSELTDQDIQLAQEAAASVGDDRIQQKTQGQVTEETWTHGSADERMHWFMSGYQDGTLDSCDTFAPGAV
jgi:predicted metalloprotease